MKNADIIGCERPIKSIFAPSLPEDLISSKAVQDMHYEPLAFLGGQFKGRQLRWLKINIEGYAVISGLKQGELLFPVTIVVERTSSPLRCWWPSCRRRLRNEFCSGAYLEQFFQEKMHIDMQRELLTRLVVMLAYDWYGG